MRGARVVRCLAVAPSGIIPAYAGSTDRIILDAMAAEDHPRICGEHVSVHAVCRHIPGSSPHMRGARGGTKTIPGVTWIIPAYAGSTRP